MIDNNFNFKNKVELTKKLCCSFVHLPEKKNVKNFKKILNYFLFIAAFMVKNSHFSQ